MEKKIRTLYKLTDTANDEYYIVAENLGYAEKTLLRLIGDNDYHIKSSIIIASEIRDHAFKELIIQE